MPPSIIICTGSFHTPSHYSPLAKLLQSKNYDVHCPLLPSMSIIRTSALDISHPDHNLPPPPSGWPDRYSDVTIIRREIKRLAEQGKRVVLVGHSYGGWVATESAIPELQMRVRREKGEDGGVVGIFYISGYVLPLGQSIDSFFSPEGDETPLPPFVTLHDHAKQGLVTPIHAQSYFFHDIPSNEADTWAAELRSQPVIKSELTNAAYRDVKCGYLYCKKDKVFPLAVQEMMVSTATSQGGEMVTFDCDAGYVPFLSRCEEVVEKIGLFVNGLGY